MCWWVWENLDKDRNAKAAADAQAQQQAGDRRPGGRSSRPTSPARPDQGRRPAADRTDAQARPRRAAARERIRGVTAKDMDTLAGQLEARRRSSRSSSSRTRSRTTASTPTRSEVITAAQTELDRGGSRRIPVAAQLTSLAIVDARRSRTRWSPRPTRRSTPRSSCSRPGWTKYSNASQPAGCAAPAAARALPAERILSLDAASGVDGHRREPVGRSRQGRQGARLGRSASSAKPASRTRSLAIHLG